MSLDERTALASQCTTDLDLPIPAVVDRMDDLVNSAYGGWPDRLYLVGKDGRIAYSGGRGPFLFNPDAFEAALEAELVGIDDEAAMAVDDAGRR